MQIKDLSDADNHDGVVTHIEHQSWTSWSVRSNEPLEALLQTKLVAVTKL